MADTNLKLLSYAQLEALGYGCRSTIWRKIKSGEFPPPIRIGVNRVAWREADVIQFVETRKVANYGRGVEMTA